MILFRKGCCSQAEESEDGGTESDETKTTATRAGAALTVKGGTEKRPAGNISDDRQRGDGDLARSIPPAGQFFLSEVLLQQRLLQRNPFPVFHFLPCSDDLHLHFRRDETEVGSTVLAEGLHLAERKMNRRRPRRIRHLTKLSRTPTTDGCRCGSPFPLAVTVDRWRRPLTVVRALSATSRVASVDMRR